MVGKYALLFGILLNAGLALAGEWQCMSVRGQIKCGNQPRKEPILVRLKDEDIGYDDLMDEGHVSGEGAFFLHGCASDPMGTIDPYVSLYHMCKGSPKRMVIKLPQEAVGTNFTITTLINLAIEQELEEDHEYHVPKCNEESTKL